VYVIESNGIVYVIETMAFVFIIQSQTYQPVFYKALSLLRSASVSQLRRHRFGIKLPMDLTIKSIILIISLF